MTEWIMAYAGKVSGSYYAWRLVSDGVVNDRNLTNSYSIRPVFYLTSSVNYISGSGTSSDPFIIS